MARQTRLPDELVICDDGSSDSTISIINSFVVTAPFLVRLYENQDKPLRSTKNFEKAIKLCVGEIIVLSDQDDVWEPHKVEVLERAIDGGAGLVFSDATLVDESLKPLGYSLFDSLDLSKTEKSLMSQNALIEILLHRNIVTGAAMAFSHKHVPLIMPISGSWIHDGWIAFLIASVDKVTISQEKLFQYRQHSSNQIGSKKLSLEKKIQLVHLRSNKYYLELLNGYLDLKARILTHHPDSSLINILDKKINHLEVRARIVNKSLLTFFSITQELIYGRYHRYSDGIKIYCRDVYMIFINIFS
jgi:glycosyltransferase involved in cell wall biosynthesis